MNWDDLRIIVAIRDRGTYAGASSQLRIDETTVARRLARIQEALGVVLFDAVDGVRKPTPHCQTVLAHIDGISREIDKISAIASQADAPARNIRLALTPSIAEVVLAPHVAAFLAVNPRLSLEFKTSGSNVNFSHWESDLAIRLRKPTKGAFVVRKLAAFQLYLFRPVARPRPGAEHIVCAYPEELDATPESSELRSAGLSDRARLVTGDINVVRSVVQSHGGIGILPEFMARDLLNDPRLVAAPLKKRREAWLLIQPHLKNDRATRLVIDWIREGFAARLERYRGPGQNSGVW